MDNLVLDASVILGWLEEGRQGEAARVIHSDVIKGKISAWVPDFVFVEVMNILYWKKKLPLDDINAFLDRILTAGIQVDDTPLRLEIHNVLLLVVRYRISAYDAQYLRLAQRLNAKLVSFDKELLQIKEWVVAPS